MCIIKTIPTVKGDGNVDTMGGRIKSARKAKGLTQSELADKVGVKYAAIHKYEAGLIVNLKRDVIAKLAEALDVKPSYLLGLDDDVVSHIHDESISGRTAAKEEMYRVYGKDHSIMGTRLVDDKVALLYYKAMERNGAAELTSILQSIENLDPDDIAKIRCTLHAYRHADQPIKEIVDTALKPYYPQDIEG